jgi:hypothetical protein
MSQKVVQYQAVMQMAQATPQIYDMVELNRQMLEVLGIKNIGKLVPSAEDQKPKDPVSENMAIINMKPVKAFAHQDHEAHIQVHMSAMQDPKIAQIVGQNPQAQAMMAAGMAHINEHIAFQYRNQIEETLGVPLPQTKDDEVMPQDIENQIASMMAMASAKLLQKNQSEAAQQKAQETAQDPIIQMQQQELQLKAKEVDIKGKKLEIDAATQAERLRIEHERIEAQKEIAGLQVGAKTTHSKNELESRMQAEGVKLGMQATKDHMELQLRQQPREKQNPTTE